MIARLLGAVLAGAVSFPAVAAAQQPLSARSIVKRLNAERAKLSLPARVQEVPDWSSKCASHNKWMSLNDVADHDEAPGTDGYSEAGDWAGTNSVLAQGTSWREGNPWANAPLHLIQLFDPDLRRAGASDDYGSSCVTTWPGIRPSSARRVWTVPAAGGRVATSEDAWEAPFTPQEKVGIAAEATTGPYLYIWSDGFDRLVSGSLAEEGGAPVATKLIDDADVGGYAGAGNGWLLPVKPLKARTRYTASVRLAGPGPDKIRTWTFSTT